MARVQGCSVASGRWRPAVARAVHSKELKQTSASRSTARPEVSPHSADCSLPVTGGGIVAQRSTFKRNPRTCQRERAFADVMSSAAPALHQTPPCRRSPACMLLRVLRSGADAAPPALDSLHSNVGCQDLHPGCLGLPITAPRHCSPPSRFTLGPPLPRHKPPGAKQGCPLPPPHRAVQPRPPPNSHRPAPCVSWSQRSTLVKPVPVRALMSATVMVCLAQAMMSGSLINDFISSTVM